MYARMYQVRVYIDGWMDQYGVDVTYGMVPLYVDVRLDIGMDGCYVYMYVQVHTFVFRV